MTHSKNSFLRICIARSERNAYSETFIRDQIEGFSKLAEVFTIHSGRLPERSEDGVLLNSRLFWVLHKIIRGISGKRNNFFGNYGLKKYLKANRINMVLANYGLTGAHLAPICRDLNIPLIVIFHGHDATDKKLLQQYAAKYNAMFKYASSVVVVSQEMRRRIDQMGAPQEKIRLVPYGIDLNKFKPSVEPKEKLFLAVGRFVAKKSPLSTIQAFFEVWKKHPETKLMMVGAHRGLYNDCVMMASSLGIQEAVLFPGILKSEEISKLMGKALAFVQHSVTAPNGDMEGTPVGILEASASGLPVISTNHGGIKEAVIHQKTGFLVDEGDISGMAAYMLKILDEPELVTSFGKAGRQHIEINYHQEKQIEKLYSLAVSAIAK